MPSCYEMIQDCCDQLLMQDKTVRKAKRLSESALASTEVNHRRRVIAASSVYVAGVLCNDKRSQNAIAAEMDVSHTSIRGCYRDILKQQGIETPQTESDPEPDPGLIRRVKQGLFGGSA